jgi:hypothetical protein
MDIVDQLKKEREELRATMASIVNIVNAKTNNSSGVKKKLLYQSKDVVVEFTEVKADGFNEVEDTPFKSELYLLDGEMEVTQKNESKTLTPSNRLMALPKGTTAKGTAKKDTAIITVININEAV